MNTQNKTATPAVTPTPAPAATPAIVPEVLPATTPVPAATPAATPEKPKTVTVAKQAVGGKALAVVSGEKIVIPENVAVVMKATGVNESMTLMSAKDYVLLNSGYSIAKGKGMKTTAVKELVGKEKAKTLLAQYNVGKRAYHIWSRKIGVLAASDPNMRQSTRVVMGKGGVLLGTDLKSRFVAQADAGLSVENAALKAEIAALKAAAQAPALPAAATA